MYQAKLVRDKNILVVTLSALWNEGAATECNKDETLWKFWCFNKVYKVFKFDQTFWYRNQRFCSPPPSRPSLNSLKAPFKPDWHCFAFSVSLKVSLRFPSSIHNHVSTIPRRLSHWVNSSLAFINRTGVQNQLLLWNFKVFCPSHKKQENYGCAFIILRSFFMSSCAYHRVPFKRTVYLGNWMQSSRKEYFSRRVIGEFSCFSFGEWAEFP